MSKFNDFMLQWGEDKFLHFMAGAAGVAITGSWIVLGILAFGKELYDKFDLVKKLFGEADETLNFSISKIKISVSIFI